MTSTERKNSLASVGNEVDKFPDFDSSVSASREHLTIYEEGPVSRSSRSPSRSPSAWSKQQNAPMHSERWMPKRANGQPRGHGRQKSLSDAIKTIRERQGSVSANAQEIAEALKAPVSYKLIILCLVWYMSSALTNTSSKAILNAYPQPITLTIVQFAFVSFWCWLSATVATLFPAVRKAIPALRDGLRSPSREVFNTTLPLALFQLGGHVLSSTATQKIPVSLVHTIKGLSPLFTVMAYRFIFHIHYSVNTYLSLIPLTGGVMLACSAEFSGNLLGIVYALVAALIFVTQNIFSKKIFNEAARAEADSLPPSQFHPKKLDKLNLLFYCSGMALVLNFPLWLWTEGFSLIGDVFTDGKVSLTERPHSLDHGPLALEFIFNGIFHFGQNIIAFVLLSMVSPVTYSVASLIKRVFVVVVAILWFRNDTTTAQGVGIAMTFLGLYLYDRTSDAARAAKHVHKAQDTPLLPLNTGMNPPPGVIYETPVSMHHRPSFSYVNGAVNGMEKKSDGEMPTRPRRSSRADWLPPGTKQEETWRMGDIRT